MHQAQRFFDIDLGKARGHAGVMKVQQLDSARAGPCVGREPRWRGTGYRPHHKGRSAWPLLSLVGLLGLQTTLQCASEERRKLYSSNQNATRGAIGLAVTEELLCGSSRADRKQ